MIFARNYLHEIFQAPCHLLRINQVQMATLGSFDETDQGTLVVAEDMSTRALNDKHIKNRNIIVTNFSIL